MNKTLLIGITLYTLSMLYLLKYIRKIKYIYIGIIFVTALLLFIIQISYVKKPIDKFTNPTNEIAIYAIATDIDRWELGYLNRSVKRAGGSLNVIVSSSRIGRLPVGFNQKVILMYKQVKEHKEDDIVMMVDGYDVMFVSSVDEIMDKYRRMNMGDKVLFSCEPGCWPVTAPYEKLCSSYPQSKDKYPYLNSGIIIGTARGWKRIIEPRLQELYDNVIDDQGFYAESFITNPELFKLDSKCEISQNLVGPVKDDIEWKEDKKRWQNKITGEYPCILHDNGSTDNHQYLKYIGEKIQMDNTNPSKSLIYN